ncbi:MAG TPA: response regulator [Thermoanaerobaculia bacterium]|nr:response regulator [Thermoanaerobaculia bacterium]
MTKPMSTGRTAIVIEDDSTIRAMVATMLARDGFVVTTVADGLSALEQLSTDEFDLIVLDLMMPGVDGFGVIDFLEENKPRRLKRVLITTAVASPMAERIPKSICTILPKPFDMAELLRHARECSEDTLAREARRRSQQAPAPA